MVPGKSTGGPYREAGEKFQVFVTHLRRDALPLDL